MMKQIAIAIKEPNKPIQMVNTTGELEDLQKIVGGYLEYIPFENGMLLWCNETNPLHLQAKSSQNPEKTRKILVGAGRFESPQPGWKMGENGGFSRKFAVLLR